MICKKKRWIWCYFETAKCQAIAHYQGIPKMRNWDIYNTHEIAYEGGLVHYIEKFLDLAIVVGCKDIIGELNSIIQFKDPEFHFSYDTTFCLSDFYLSPVLNLNQSC